MKFQFISEHKEEFPVRVMCEILEVSESGYYGWRKRPVNPRVTADQILEEQIKPVFEQSRQTYGSPRIHAALKLKGVSGSRKR